MEVGRKGGSKKGVKRKEMRESPMMGDNPRWNLDEAKFGKRRRVYMCVCVYVRRLAESAMVPVSRLRV